MIRYVWAVAGGAAVAMSLPPWGLWPLAFVGFAVLSALLADEPRWRGRARLGFVFALAWMLIGLAWMWFLTAPGYVVACAIFASLHAAAAAIPNGSWSVVSRPAAHLLAEAFRMLVPFGGVPLATVGIGQAGGPLLGVARVGGVLLLSWIVMQIGFLVGAVAQQRFRIAPAVVDATHRSSPRAHARVATAAAMITGAALAVSAIAPTGTPTGQQLDVAAVQGGGEQGTSALDVPSRQVTRVHLDATTSIEPDATLDLVVWPENGIDVNGEPFVGSEPFRAVAAEAARLGVPIAVGVTDDSEYSLVPRDDSFVNAQVVVNPDGSVSSRYEKVQLVPFGEYVPLRSLFERLGVDLSRVAGDAVSGQGPAVIELRDGTRIGVMISWEVFFSERGRAAVAEDTAFLINPTNGASYTWTIVQTQQVASSRLRAVETGRWVVQVSPTGFTAFVSPSGEVFDRTDVGEQQVIRRQIELRSGSTWYARWGDRPLLVFATLVLVLALAADTHGDRSRRRVTRRASV